MKVGILGGGQLGLMLAEAVLRLGHDPVVYDPSPSSPCARRLAGTVRGAFDDLDALQRFVDGVDRLTYESENLPTAALRQVRGLHKVWPSLDVLEIVQDRVHEKRFLRRHELPHAMWWEVPTLAALPRVVAAAAEGRELPPLVLKTATGGYDGKGQHRIDDPADLAGLVATAAGRAGRWVLEERVGIGLEVSCIVARDAAGAVQTFPVFENLHRDHILDVTVVPARIAPAVAEAVREVAVRCAEAMDVRGLLTTEFFLLREPGLGSGPEVDGWHLRVNEFAPRTHNSGHVSRAACGVSQFEALARLLVDAPVPSLDLLPGSAWAMGQLLGRLWDQQGVGDGALSWSALAHHPDVVEVYDYGKRPPRPQRKMGHCIARGDTPEAAAEAVEAFRRALVGGSSTAG